MKLCSLIFTLVVTIYGVEYSRHHHHHGIFKDPKAFVSSLNKIDEDSINKMIDTVNKLIDDGETERGTVQAVRDAAEDDYNAKEQARLDAASAHANATTLLSQGEEVLVEQKVAQADAQATYDASLLALNNATVDEAAALEEKNLQSARIDREKATLNEVRELIADISAEAGKALAEMNKGRNLLAVDYKALASADPSSIDEVIDLIDELLSAGETERATYVDAWADANQILVAAQAAHDSDEHTLKIAIGVVDRQIITNQELAADVASKLEEVNTASLIRNEAFNELGRQDNHLFAESTRLDSEKETCEQIIELLQDLVAEEPEEEGGEA